MASLFTPPVNSKASSVQASSHLADSTPPGSTRSHLPLDDNFPLRPPSQFVDRPSYRRGNSLSPGNNYKTQIPWSYNYAMVLFSTWSESVYDWANRRVRFAPAGVVDKFMSRMRDGRLTPGDQKLISAIALGNYSGLLSYFRPDHVPILLQRFSAADVMLVGYLVAQVASHNTKSSVKERLLDGLMGMAQKISSNSSPEGIKVQIGSIAQVISKIATATNDDEISAKAIAVLIEITRLDPSTVATLVSLVYLSSGRFKTHHVRAMIEIAKENYEMSRALQSLFERRPDLFYQTSTDTEHAFEPNREFIDGLIQVARLEKGSDTLYTMACRQSRLKEKLGRTDVPELLAGHIPQLTELSRERPFNLGLYYLAVYSESESIRLKAFVGMLMALAHSFKASGGDSKFTQERKRQLVSLFQERPEMEAVVGELAQTLRELVQEDELINLEPLFPQIEGGLFQEWLAA